MLVINKKGDNLYVDTSGEITYGTAGICEI